MKSSTLWSVVGATSLLGVVLASGAAVRARPTLASAAGPADPAAPSQPATFAEVVAPYTAAAPGAKLDATLTDWLKSEPAKRDWIMVQSTRRLDLKPYGFVHQFTWPAGEEVAILEATAKDALAIAADRSVYRIDSASPDGKPNPDAPALEEPVIDPANLARLGAMARNAPDWSAAAPAHAQFMAETNAARDAALEGEAARADGEGPGLELLKGPIALRKGGPSPKGWYDVRNGHAAQEAWGMGFRGDDVAVAVLDYEVDYAHPDLQDTWRTLPAGHPYAGWPEVFDPIVGYLAVVDKRLTDPMTRSTRANQFDTSRVELYQTSTVTPTVRAGATVGQVCVRPRVSAYTPSLGQLAQIHLGDMDCAFVVPNTSKGGTVRYGHHPDVDLAFISAAAAVQGSTAVSTTVAWPGILAVDEAAAGVYDTVYVDMDGDKDFTDEKPVRKGDPLAHRDMSNPPDGITDASGGLFYWIADGVNPFPGMWLWGLEKDIPAAGSEVGVFLPTRGGNHGTLCASNVVSQGRLPVPSDRSLKFRDLKAATGKAEPPAVNFGIAPRAKMVSVGSVYDGRAGARAAFGYGWRFAAFGTDKVRTDDDIQITSNSYGWSNVDNDGWEADSRIIDYYIRTFAPNSSWLFATGNGGPGYGTIAPPSPSAGIDVAASTQYGASGWHSITDTTQITYGDIIPFSNRGPGATGQNGVDVAGNGASGTGAVPITFLLVSQGVNSSHAYGTWGGTSRATPVSAGTMAIGYQAFKSKYNRWPTWAEARAVLRGGARFAGYDTLTMGSGVVDAADTARIASGHSGVYALPDEWSVGGYRGTHYDGFASLIAPGQTATRTFTLHNPSDKPLPVTLSAQSLRRVKGMDGTLKLRAADESSANAQLPDYVVPLKKDDIPEGTDLMVFRGRQPMQSFDPDGDFGGTGTTFNNLLIGSVIQHTDINGNGKLWNDVNRNGAVNYRTLFPIKVTATWGGGSADYYGIEGGITKQMNGVPFSGQIAWYGLGCNDNAGNPPLPAQDVSEKIALIERGTCTFVEKIANATSAGAIGVLVFSDVRPVVIMGGTPPVPIEVPGVMIPRVEGIEIRDRLQAGEAMTVRFAPSDIPPVGLDGLAAVDYSASELETWEFMRFSNENNYGNTFEVSVHHPRERWADGLYLGVSHAERSPVTTDTLLSYRLDSYKYQPWSAVTLSDAQVTVPAGGERTFTATFHVPADAASGVWQGAIFAEYARGEGDLPVPAPGGYELPQHRMVIPVVANIASTYDWKGAISLGGTKGMDMDATYNNGAVRGAQNWNWRPESGDWRFFFVDAMKAVPGTYWIFRTQWDEDDDHLTDVDTRIMGPSDDVFSNPAHPGNATESKADGGWYGPHGMELVGGSTNTNPAGLTNGFFPIDTNTGANEEWFAMPSTGGLHEIMLDNVAFGGHKMEVPVETTASSLQVSNGDVVMWGKMCRQVTITSQMDLPGFMIQSFSGLPPQVTTWTAKQDDPQARGTAHLKEDVTLDRMAGGFTATVDAPNPTEAPGLDLDLLVLYDKNADGLFDPAAEVIGQSTSEFGDEQVKLQGTQAAGDYQVWVHGFAVPKPVTYTLSIQVYNGDAFTVTTEDLTAAGLVAGKALSVNVCPTVEKLEDQPEPAGGLLVFGPGAMPGLFQVPLSWYSRAPHAVMLPLNLMLHDMASVPEAAPTP